MILANAFDVPSFIVLKVAEKGVAYTLSRVSILPALFASLE